MIEERLRTILLADSNVSGLVGQRIRPDALAQDDAYPAAIIEVEDEDPLAMLSEVGGLQKAKVLITSLDSNRTGATGLARKIRTALDGYAGTVSGTNVKATFEGRKNGFDSNEDGTDDGVYFSESEFEVWWDDAT